MGAMALSTLGAQAQTMGNSTTGTMGTGTMSGTAGTGTMGSGDMSGTTGTTGGSTGTMSGGTMGNGTMSGGMTGTMSTGGSMMGGMGAMSAPMPVSGTVTRYYVDRAGFVSAMDVQTTDGARMVRFSPSMAQRLTSMYPVGSTISGFVTSSGMGSMMSYDLAGTGTMMPAPGMMMPTMINDLDILRSTPYVMLGSKEMSVTGKLTDYIADPNSGQILALVLDKNTLVRVPAQNRLEQSSLAPEGVRDLLKGALISARGMDEAPRFGVVSPYARRVVASGISVDGRTLGTFGFGRVIVSRKKMMSMMNGGMMNADYMPYMAPGSDSSMTGGMTGTTGTSTMGTGTMDGTAGTGTMGSGTPGTMGTGTTGTGTTAQ